MRKIFFYLLGLSVFVYLISTCSKTPSDQTQATTDHQQQNVSDDSLRAMIDEIPDAPPAVKVFADVPATLGLLSRAGIGPMRSWRNDGMGYMSSTPYYSFGANSDENGLANNLAFYAESSNEKAIRTVKLMLNVNNASQNKAARSLYAKTALATLTTLKIKTPAGLESALLKGRDFTAETSTATIANEHHTDRIDWDKLIITSR